MNTVVLVIVIILLVLVGLPLLLWGLLTLGILDLAKKAEKEGYCLTKDNMGGATCSIASKSDCKKKGGTHYSTASDCQAHMNTNGGTLAHYADF